jgi:DNA mismatch repair protein MutH
LIPRTEAELFQRARALAGRTLGSIAAEHGSVPPVELVKAKGWAGQLLERALGASAASRAEPDFQHLGVELKSLPVDARGRPRESTFVCTIALSEIGDVEWESSRVWRKLRRVLWLPIEADRRLLPAERRVGEPLLWSPSAEEESALRFDWEELSGLIGRGAVEAITGHLGKWLQVRPKAANGQARRRALDADGVGFATLPRGFYLRAAFTARLLASHYAIGRP